MTNKYDRALELLKQTSNIKIKGKPIHSYFTYKGFSLWSFYQQLILVTILSQIDDIKQEQTRPSFNIRLRLSLLRFFSILVSFLSLLILKIKKPDVVIYSDDITVGKYRNDPRIQQLYEYCVPRHISYSEIIHSNLHWKYVKNFFRRLRPVLYLESIDYFAPLYRKFLPFPAIEPITEKDIELGGIASGNKELALLLVKTYLGRMPASLFRIKILRVILKFIRPKVLLLIDDMRFWHEILVACSEVGIPTIAFQHSRFNKYFCGLINYGIPPEKCPTPDKFIIWNEHWKKVLISLSPTFSHYQERIIMGGKPGIARKELMGYSRPSVSSGLTVLIPFESTDALRAIGGYLEAFLNDPRIKIFFKIRKDVPVEEQLRGLPPRAINEPRFKVVSEITVEKINSVNICVGTHSTVLYEMAEVGMPIGILRVPNMIQADDLVDAGFAKFINLDDPDLYSKLVSLAQIPQDVIEEQKIIFRSLPFTGKAIDDILNK